MKWNLLGTVLGGVMLLAATAPAGASPLAGTTVENFVGALGVGDTLNFDAGGASGISDGSYDGATKTYYDYIFSFSVTGPAKASIQAGGVASGGDFSDFHAVLYDVSPAGSDLNSFLGHTNPGQPDDETYDGIDITDGTGFQSGGSTSNGGSNVGLSLASLDTGTYYLRLFGALGSGASLASLSGSFSLSAVATTPIPAALPLFLSALGALGFVARRRKATAAVAA